MNFIFGVIAVIFALVVVLVLLAFVIGDIKKAKKYANATKVQGIVYENCGVEKVASYGRNQYRKYGKYLIQYHSQAGVQVQPLLLRNKKLQKGDTVEVRYSKEGANIQLIDNVSTNRLLELVISFMIVMIIGILVFYFK